MWGVLAWAVVVWVYCRFLLGCTENFSSKIRQVDSPSLMDCQPVSSRVSAVRKKTSRTPPARSSTARIATILRHVCRMRGRDTRLSEDMGCFCVGDKSRSGYLRISAQCLSVDCCIPPCALQYARTPALSTNGNFSECSRRPKSASAQLVLQQTQ